MADAEATCLGGYSLAPETSPNESAEGAIFKQGHKVTNGRIGSDQTTTAVIQDTQAVDAHHCLCHIWILTTKNQNRLQKTDAEKLGRKEPKEHQCPPSKRIRALSDRSDLLCKQIQDAQWAVPLLAFYLPSPLYKSTESTRSLQEVVPAILYNVHRRCCVMAPVDRVCTF